MSYNHPHWHHYYKRYNRMFYGPSRLLWFAFGSVATWAWVRHHQDACPRRVGYNPPPQWERDQPAPPPNNNASSSSSSRGDYIGHASGQWRPTTQPQPPMQPQGQTQSDTMTQMDYEHERLRQLGRNAEETISGMSEATIESMMNVLQRLKDRLAERRGQQQLQEIGPQQTNPTPGASPEGPTGPRHRV